MARWRGGWDRRDDGRRWREDEERGAGSQRRPPDEGARARRYVERWSGRDEEWRGGEDDWRERGGGMLPVREESEHVGGPSTGVHGATGPVGSTSRWGPGGAGYAGRERLSRGRFREGFARPAGRGPKNYRRPDEWIREEVCEAIARSGVDAEDIDVLVADGEVTLDGEIRDRADKRHIEELAEDVFGVEEVHNHLRVRREAAGARDARGDEEGLGDEAGLPR